MIHSILMDKTYKNAVNWVYLFYILYIQPNLKL